MKASKVLVGAIELAVPIIGWYFFYKSIKQVKPGQISVVNNGKKHQELEAGVHFHPFPWDSFGSVYSKDLDYIDFGAFKRVRILPGQRGIKMNTDGKYVTLEPGIHIIQVYQGEVFDVQKGVQNINVPSYTLGDEQIFTITVGQVAVVSTRNGINIIDTPGQHRININDGSSLKEIINKSSQVLVLPPLTVMCADQISMKAQSMLTYTVTDPSKTIGLGINTIIEFLKKLGDGALRTILSRYNSADVAPSLHHEGADTSETRVAKLQEIHDRFVADLDLKAADWGIHISDLVITEILPADESYRATIQKIGTQRATIEAQKKIARTEAEVAIIKAEAEQSRVVAAKIEQQEAEVRAMTESKKMAIGAQAKADVISVVAKAEANRLQLLNEITRDATPLTTMIAEYEGQAKLLSQISQPVYIPQPAIGKTRIYGGKSGERFTVFHNESDKNGSFAVNDALTMQLGNQLLKREGESTNPTSSTLFQG